MARYSFLSAIIILFILNFIVIDQGFGVSTESIFSVDHRSGALGTPITHQKISGIMYESHAPISISSNSEFNDLIIYEGWEGDGSYSDPYIIDGLSITGSGTLIKIHNTNVHFKISNCLLTDGEKGVDFYQVSNGMILDCTISDNARDGIYLFESDSITIEGNDIKNNGWRGIWTYHSTELNIHDNTFSDNSWYGIDLRFSPNNRIVDNDFFRNGFILRGLKTENCTQAEVSGNTVNGKPLIYWQNKVGGTVPMDAGQIVLYKCKDVEITSVSLSADSAGITAVLCSDLDIHDNHITDNTAAGIYLWLSSDNKIRANELHNNGLFMIGLEVDDCFQDEVTDNTVNDKPLVYWQSEEGKTVPSGAGQIVLVDCDEIEIKDQVLEKTADGILTCFSSDINIHDNFIINNIFPGIFVWFSKRVDISANLIADNKDSGVYIEDSPDLSIEGNTIRNNEFGGIYGGYQSDDITITKNIIADNLDDGILLDYTIEGSIKHNVFENNELYGIRLDNCEDYEVEQNDFIGNNPEGDSQAYDGNNYGEKNSFSHNYWDDWISPDKDEDGLVDDPYSIDGDSENEDPDPETTPNNPDLATITYQPRAGEITPSWSFPLFLTGIVFYVLIRRIIRRRKSREAR
ncbi:MAG: right-handed parallel beta-helix repeat-containing protein [Candidatus Heimdallarchaeota archaeon]|nr:MAG: right-handed parallel beta-helix repeat-containing protein [Candidatus Heimdallarchaeota archaeon]